MAACKAACFHVTPESAKDMRKVLEGFVADRALRQAEQEPVARLEGIDEYGPRLEWFSPWVNLPVGAKLYAEPRPIIAQPVQPTTKESLTVHASAEDYLRHQYGARRGHFAWRELEEAYSQGRYDETMAQGPSLWPDDESVNITQPVQPLTDEQIAGVRKRNELETISIEAFRCVARAIEAAYGTHPATQGATK